MSEILMPEAYLENQPETKDSSQAFEPGMILAGWTLDLELPTPVLAARPKVPLAHGEL